MDYFIDGDIYFTTADKKLKRINHRLSLDKVFRMKYVQRLYLDITV